MVPNRSSISGFYIRSKLLHAILDYDSNPLTAKQNEVIASSFLSIGLIVAAIIIVLLSIILGLLYRNHTINEEIMRKNEELEKNIYHLRSELLLKEEKERQQSEQGNDGFIHEKASDRGKLRQADRWEKVYRSESNDCCFMKVHQTEKLETH